MTSPAANHYDAIVVGIGAMGSAAVYQLARRGKRVLGLERFDIPHDLGSSHGVTRIIRLAYFEHPSYVPLLRRSYELWRDLQAQAGEQLLYITGGIDAGVVGSRVVDGSMQSCLTHNLPHQVLTGAELQARFPAFHVAPEMAAIFQPEGGFLLPERCIVAFVNAAHSYGAEIHAREPVIEWLPRGDGVCVHTARAEYIAEKLIISVGAWASRLVPFLKKLLAPERQVLAWLQPKRSDLFSHDRFPVFILQVDEGIFYGFPVFGIPGFKFGKYHHLFEKIDPDRFEREPNERDEHLLRAFAEKYFPDGAGPTMALKSCIFTNSPDEHFIIDTHPEYPQVLIASPCSGHGFKFASVVGEIIGDLAERGETRHDIEQFRLARFTSIRRHENAV
jgi:sarcosine oxidase